MASKILKFRSVTLKDVKELSKIHKDCFTNFWNEKSIKDLLKNFNGIVVENGKELLGFIIFSEIDSEAEIITFCIGKNFQNSGLGSKLLEFFINNVKASKIFLEVSKENEKAFKLYLKMGFQVINVRKHYYLENKIFYDAIVMEKTVKPERNPYININ